jgi:hypothetical protein
MRDWVGKIIKVKKYFAQHGEKTSAWCCGRKSLVRWAALDGWVKIIQR